MSAQPSRIVAAILLCCALIALGAISAAAQGTLLSSSLPGAFGVRYLPDRAVVTYTVPDPGERAIATSFRLRVRLPQRVRWGFLDREPMAERELRWDRGASQAIVRLPFGSHRVHLGWEGKPYLPPESATIPIVADGDPAGQLRARFQLDGMEASGDAVVGPGIASVRVETAPGVGPADLTLSSGNQTVTQWRRANGALVTAEPLLIAENPGINLHVSGYTLQRSPVKRVVFENVTPPAQVAKVADEIPENAILVEGEDFVDNGGTPPQVEPGSHYDTHGGACVYSFLGDGSWITWKMSVPEAGSYDLYARISCGDTSAYRLVEFDGEAPEGLHLVEFPGTGGWGHAEGEWWLVRITGGEGLAPSLDLEAGDHALTLTGVLQKHLNIDYLLLVPAE